MEIAVLVLHVFAALGIIGLVLLQHGKGADVGAAFGGGASGSLFGASGSANFLSRITAVLAFVFFLTSLGLTYFSGHKTEQHGVMANTPAQEQPLPSQVPGQGAPAAGTQPQQQSGVGSKAPEVPK